MTVEGYKTNDYVMLSLSKHLMMERFFDFTFVPLRMTVEGYKTNDHVTLSLSKGLKRIKNTEASNKYAGDIFVA